MINHSDILQLCRLCLVEEKVNHSIFEEAGGLRGIFLKITSCLPVSISQDDSLPKKICDSCSSKLDTFYQFWNETANAEKQLLQWLNQTTLGPISKAGQTETKNKMDAAEVKEETIDVVEASYEEEMRLSTDAKSYVLQQQQLPYSAPPPKVRPAVENNETEEPASKRPRRASAMKALEHMGSEDEDDPEYDGDNYTKAETDDSEKDDDDEEDETYQEGPSTSMDDQPGPSGMGKGTTEAPFLKPCEVRLNEVGHLLDANGYYVVPGRRFRWLTCYSCFQKFRSAELLEIHKLTHEQESEEEIDKLSDSDALLESESDGEEPEEVSTTNKNIRASIRNSMRTLNSESNIENVVKTTVVPSAATPTEKTPRAVRKIAVSPVVPSVKPTQIKPVQAVANPVKQNTNQDNKVKKLPAINNIHIKCLNCDLLFTNSEQLMEHKPVDPGKICCFTCKVCSEKYSTPDTYMEHIMQHNAFTPRNHVVVSKVNIPQANDLPKKYRYICVLCNSRFEDCYQLRRHEIIVHDKKEEQVYQSDKNKTKVVVLKDLYPGTQKKTDDLITQEKDKQVVIPGVISMPNTEVGENLEAIPTESAIKPVVAKVVPNSSGRKRGRPPSSGTSNEKIIKMTPTSNDKILVQQKLKFKQEDQASKPTELKSTRISVMKRVVDTLSFNVLRTPEPSIDKKCSITATTSEVPLEEQPQDALSIKTESLVCDICFDVFSDAQSFEEHMEFHNNLDCTLNSKNSASENNGGEKKTVESDDDVTIVEDESTPKIKAFVSQQDCTSTEKGLLGKQRNFPNQKKTRNEDYGENSDERMDEGTDSSNDAAEVSKSSKKFPTQCEDCKLNFKKHRSLRLHVAKKIHCSVCSFTTCKLPDARSHMLKDHELHFCWRCKETFEKAELLKNHYKNDHTCSKCNRVVTVKEGHKCTGTS